MGWNIEFSAARNHAFGLLSRSLTHALPEASRIAAFHQREKNMASIIGRLMHDESGATAIEYGLIAALVALALITALTSMGTSVSGKFNSVANELNK